MLQTLALSALSWRPPPPTRGAEGLSVAYFAFGANMARSVLTGRRGVVPLDAAPGRVKGHTLAFNLPGIPLVEPAFASIERAEPDAECHGVLYTLTPEDWLKVCATEGVFSPFGMGGYRVVSLPVALYDERTVPAFTLQAGGARVPSAMSLPPSERYLNLLKEGARENGLSLEWQRYLARIKPSPFSVVQPPERPRADDPRRQRAYERRSGATFV